MARLIEQAAAAGYDGVIVTIADFNVLQGAIGKVTAKKIPLITINSGTTEQSEKLGAIMHVGQPEYAAGKGAGERAKAAGVKSFLCVNHYATNPATFERCRGFARSDRRRLQEVHARLGRRSDDDRVEGRRLPAPEPRHQRRADARTDVGQPDDQGARKIGPSRQDLHGHLRPVRRHQQGHQGRHGASSRSTSSRTCRATSRWRCWRR